MNKIKEYVKEFQEYFVAFKSLFVTEYVKEFQEYFVAFKSLFVTEYDGAGQDTGKWLN